MYENKSVRVSFIGSGDVLQHITCVKGSKYGMSRGEREMRSVK